MKLHINGSGVQSIFLLSLNLSKFLFFGYIKGANLKFSLPGKSF